jgi:SAM-dependent methyltransferase
MQPRGESARDDWNQHWDSYAASASLNPAQAYRRRLIFERLELGSGPCRVLELGSGQGDFSRELLERHPQAELLGLDISQSGIDLAARKVPRARFLRQDLTQPFDIPDVYRSWATHAVCSEVLEHVDDAVQVLKNARRCLAPGARLVVTVPAGPRSAFDLHIGHKRHFTPESLGSLLRAAGLESDCLHGAGFPFFNLYRLVVLARGEKLIDDAGARGRLPLAARAAMRAFSWLFELNSGATPWGWQLVAVAREPGGLGRRKEAS